MDHIKAYKALAIMANSLGIKAPRDIPGQSDPLNPDVDEMNALEDWGTTKMRRALNKMQRDILRGIDSVSDIIQNFRSPEVQRPFQNSIRDMINRYTLEGAEFGRFQVESEIFGIKQIDMWELANVAAAEWAQQHAAQLIFDLNTTTLTRLQRIISDAVEDGATIGQVSQSIRQSGIFGESRALMIAVTELTTAFSQGNLISWQSSGVVEAKEWRTNRDELVCPQCGPLNGEQVALGDEFDNPVTNADMPAPPAHPNCRCWVVPVVER